MSEMMLVLAQGEVGPTAMVAAGVVAVFVIFTTVMLRRYTKVGPNEVLVVSGVGRGGRGFRIVKGGGTFVWPVVEKAEVLSLELMTLDVKTPEVYTITGVPVLVDGVAQIKVKGDLESIATAAEQFLSKPTNEIMKIALQTVEGHLRAILGTMTVEEIYKNRDTFAQRVQEVAAGDMANMGLQIVSFTLRDIRDNQGYLDALGKPRTAQVKRDAVVGQAESDRDATIKSAEYNRAGQQAKFLAETEIAQARRDYEIKSAEYQAGVNKAKADADLAYDLQKYTLSQAVKAEEIKVMAVEKEGMIEVQDKEIQRRTKELEATVQKPADAERYKAVQLADAERYRLTAEAEGRAAAARAMGLGEAEAQKARGLADADVIRATGEAEAEAMQKKADSWRSYTEAAITQMFIEKMPEIARAIAEPLTRTEKIVIINNGNGTGGTGASKITKDVTEIMGQLPDILSALTDVDVKELIRKVPGLGGRLKDKDAAGDGKTAQKN